MFRSILVPLDGSQESATAVPLARTVARTTGGQLHLLTVTPSDAPTVEAAASVYVQTTAALVCDPHLSVQTAVRVGDAATEVVTYARQRAIDLIVMATRAVGPHSILALTSVAQEVVARSPCPVLVTRRDDKQPEQMRTLLVPIDASPGGALALAAARALATPENSRVVLLDVVVPVPCEAAAALPGMTVGGYIDPAWEDLARMSARAYVEGVASRLQACGTVAEARVATGDVSDEILRCAQEIDADAVVMSTHSVEWPARAYVPSVADTLIREGVRPVLLVKREPRPAFRASGSQS
jgi:nucleotide-binding universal stress UspA family protein